MCEKTNKKMIEIKDLSFSYSKQKFIENLSFDVKLGEIFGFLGPSGAGKSTIQKILIGLLPGYDGSVVVNGTEVSMRKNSFYEEIGVDFEYPTLYEKLTARQNLEFFGSLYSGEKYDVQELLEMVALQNDADKKVSDFSKGMRSRLNFVKAFIHKPKMLFLDEPTSGLDPANARTMKDIILKLREQGTTIIITTHNMQDAQELCDRVAFIVDGDVKELETPHNLIMRSGAAELRYTYLEAGVEQEAGCLVNQTATDTQLHRLLNENRILTIHSTEPNLGDIFCEITGRKLS